jgi:hypothetical protein
MFNSDIKFHQSPKWFILLQGASVDHDHQGYVRYLHKVHPELKKGKFSKEEDAAMTNFCDPRVALSDPMASSR